MNDKRIQLAIAKKEELEVKLNKKYMDQGEK